MPLFRANGAFGQGSAGGELTSARFRFKSGANRQGNSGTNVRPLPRSAEKQLIAEETAKMLLEVGAVLFNAEKPFIFTSGWASPVYTDMRKLIAFPRLRTVLLDFAVKTIQREIGYESLDIIAGGETAGIPFAAWISDRLGLPMQYVRKKPKGFGRNARIEGEVTDGARTLLVEDLATDGASEAQFLHRHPRGRPEMRPHLRVLLLRYFPRSPRRTAQGRHRTAPAHDVVGRAESARARPNTCPTRRSTRWRNSCAIPLPGPPRMAAPSGIRQEGLILN